jgi:hypothetical protein
MADSAVARISAGVHGPLLEALAKRLDYHDSATFELFRFGAPLIGQIERLRVRFAFSFCVLVGRLVLGLC